MVCDTHKPFSLPPGDRAEVELMEPVLLVSAQYMGCVSINDLPAICNIM